MPKKKSVDGTYPIAPVTHIPTPHVDVLGATLRRYQETFVKVTKMFYDLVELAKLGHGGSNHPTPQPWLVADRLDQEALCAIQMRLTEILGEFAFTLGPQFEELLLKELPYLFSQSDSKAG
jgi:hypothetical protein